MSSRLLALLGVASDASPAAVRAAWKVRTRELHPDKKTGNHEAFVELQAAWEAWKEKGDAPVAAAPAAPAAPAQAQPRRKRKRASPPPRRPAAPPNETPSMSRAEVREILRKHEASVRAARRRKEARREKQMHKMQPGGAGASIAEVYEQRVSDVQARKVKVVWRGGAVLSRRALTAVLAEFGAVDSVSIGARFAVATFASRAAAEAAVWGVHEQFDCTFCVT